LSHSVFKIDYKEKVGCDNIDWIYLAQHRGQWQAHLEYSMEPWSSMNGGEFLYQLTISLWFCCVELIMLVLLYACFINNTLHSIIVLVKIILITVNKEFCCTDRPVSVVIL
jgi:hypothetical protein